jgi:hypothetical protein
VAQLSSKLLDAIRLAEGFDEVKKQIAEIGRKG